MTAINSFPYTVDSPGPPYEHAHVVPNLEIAGQAEYELPYVSSALYFFDEGRVKITMFGEEEITIMAPNRTLLPIRATKIANVYDPENPVPPPTLIIALW